VNSPKEAREEWDLKPDAEIDYEYYINVIASESFKNIITKFGVDVGYEKGKIHFFLNKRIDLKSLKTRGIIASYRITKWVKTKSVVEEEG